jgi:hypothetical protein
MTIPVKRSVAFALAVTFAVALTTGSASVAPSEPADSDEAKVAELALKPRAGEPFSTEQPSAATLAEAQALAIELGVEVEILERRTENESSYAMVDGGVRHLISTGPQWARLDGSGLEPEHWTPIDVELVRDGDVLRPRATNQVVELGTEGSAMVVRSHSADGLGMTYTLKSGELPAPEIDGARAIYRDVQPGLDIVVEVTRTNVEYFVIAHTAEAAQGADEVELVAEFEGLAPHAGTAGDFRLLDDDGVEQAAILQALAWDANQDLKRGNPVLEPYSSELRHAPVERALDGLTFDEKVDQIHAFMDSPEDLNVPEIEPIGVALEPTGEANSYGVSLDVSEDWLNDSGTVYPVVLDPAYGFNLDTYVTNKYPSTSYASSSELLLGTPDSGTSKYRVFLGLTWPSGTYYEYSSAKLYMFNYHSWTCYSTSYLDRIRWHAYDTDGNANSSTTWNNMPSLDSGALGSSTSTKGYSGSCPDDWAIMDIADVVDKWVGEAIGSSSKTQTMMLRAKHEDDNYGWKRFYSAQGTYAPYFELIEPSYTNEPPDRPTNPTVAGQPVSAQSVTAITMTGPLRPAIAMNVTDPNNKRVAVRYTIYADRDKVGEYWGSGVVSGGTSVYQPGFDFEPNVIYSVDAIAVDAKGAVSEALTGMLFTLVSQPPETPTDVKIGGVSVSGAHQLASNEFELSANVTDPNGVGVKVHLTIRRGAVDGPVILDTLLGTATTSGTSVSTYTWNAGVDGDGYLFVPGHEYFIEVRTWDGGQTSADKVTIGPVSVASPGQSWFQVPTDCDTYIREAGDATC